VKWGVGLGEYLWEYAKRRGRIRRKRAH
jgi:hypothetical protein